MITGAEYKTLARVLKETVTERDHSLDFLEGFLTATKIVIGALGMDNPKYSGLPFLDYADLSGGASVIRVTTAPRDVDGAGTRTIEVLGRDKTHCYRLVAIPRADWRWQEKRYFQGSHACFDRARWQELLSAPWFQADWHPVTTKTEHR